MPSVTVRIPDSLRTSGYIDVAAATGIPAAAKARLASILARDDLHQMREPAREVSVHASLWVNAVDAARIEELGAENDMSLGEVITALLVEDAQRKAHALSLAVDLLDSPGNAQPKSYLDTIVLAQGKKPRVEQQQFHGVLAKLFDPEIVLPKVLFAEAGTGTGKTLAYLSTAHQFAKENPTSRIAFTAPTHANISKMMEEWRDVQTAAGPISTVCLVGQGEFVSAQALAGIEIAVGNEETKKKIRAWSDAGAPACPDSSVRHAWTVAGLICAAPEFALVADVTLDNRDDDTDLGFISYKAQWSKLDQAQVIVLTHAMLASLIRRRIAGHAKKFTGNNDVMQEITYWKSLEPAKRENALYDVLNRVYAGLPQEGGPQALPDLDFLVVDEAQQLEDAFSLVLSQGFSLWSLRNDLIALKQNAPSAITLAMFAQLEDVWNRLRNAPDSVVDKPVALSGEYAVELENLLTALKPVLKYEGNKGGAAHRRLVQAAWAIELAVTIGQKYEGSMAATIEWSPDRKWPRLMVGRLSVARELNYLWRVVAKRTALVSGTLYEEIPQLSHEAARRSLAVSHDMCMSCSPVHGMWQYEKVSVCTVVAAVTPGGRRRFVRPRKDCVPAGEYASLWNEWINDMANYLCETFRTGEGGLLVLGTAYADVGALAELMALKLPQARILCQRPKVTLASLRKDFLATAESGERPILLAVGGAWTGFDLHSDKEPNALTDLAILNAPFGAVSRSFSRQYRMQRQNGLLELAAQTLILIRQGIGRLVRSPDTLPNRRIHWLDARIHSSEHAGLLNPAKRLLHKYNRRLNVT